MLQRILFSDNMYTQVVIFFVLVLQASSESVSEEYKDFSTGYNSSELIEERSSTIRRQPELYGPYPGHTYKPVTEVDYYGNEGLAHNGIHYPEEVYPVQTHPDSSHHNGAELAVKALLVPLVGVALIGLVTALISNPVLLQLGVLSGKKRKRRHSDPTAEKLHHLSLIAGIISQIPKSNVMNEEKKMVANYLQCSGLGKLLTESCLQRLNCEAWSTASEILPSQRHLIRMVLSDILGNEYIEKELRNKIEDAKVIETENCTKYVCEKMPDMIPQLTND